MADAIREAAWSFRIGSKPTYQRVRRIFGASYALYRSRDRDVVRVAANAGAFLQTSLSEVTRRSHSRHARTSRRRVTPDRVLALIAIYLLRRNTLSTRRHCAA